MRFVWRKHNFKKARGRAHLNTTRTAQIWSKQQLDQRKCQVVYDTNAQNNGDGEYYMRTGRKTPSDVLVRKKKAYPSLSRMKSTTLRLSRFDLKDIDSHGIEG